MTDELLAFVLERLSRYVQGGRADPALILSDDVTEAAAELWRSAVQEPPAGAVPYEIVRTLAVFHWNRHGETSGGIDLHDLQVAAVMFAHIFKIEPESTPDQLRGLLANELDVLEIQGELGPPARWAVEVTYRGATEAGGLNRKVRTGPDWQVREASAILRRAAKDHTADLDLAVSLLRSAVSVLAHDHPVRADALAWLSNAYELRFVRLGNPADQDEAVDVARAAATEYPAGARQFRG